MALVDETRRLVGVAERLKGPVGNEANTKALLIEPLLSALGWDTTDVAQMVRDWPIDNNVSIDYALRINDANAVLVETRGVNESLDDERFIAQTVDSVNNEGVAWCVLTNGLIYRVYKANEPVAMDQKLLLEVDLSGGGLGWSAGSAQSLSLLARASVADGSLQRRGDQVFTDPRVHEALTQLAADPSSAFLDAVAEAIGEPAVPANRLRASLARVFDGDSGAADEANAARARSVPETPELSARPEMQARSPVLATRQGLETPGVLGGLEVQAPREMPPRPEVVAPADVWAPPEVPAPREKPAPQEVPPTPQEVPPTPQEVPPTPQEVPPTPQEVPPTPQEVPPTPQEVPPTPQEVPPTPQEVPPPEVPPPEVLAPPEVSALPATETHAAVAVTALGAEYPLADHLGDKAPAIVDLFGQLDEYGRSLDATRRVRRDDVAYFRGEKSCFTLEIERERIVLALSLDPAAVDAWWWSPTAGRYTIDLRPRGIGEMEYSVGEAADLDNALQLIKLAYDVVPSPAAVR